MSTSPPQAPERFLSVPQAAEYLGISTRTLHRRLVDGTLTANRVGPRLLRFDREQLAALARPEVRGTAVDPLAEHVAAVVAAAPELTTEQRDKLAGLLRSTAGSDSR